MDVAVAVVSTALMLAIAPSDWHLYKRRRLRYWYLIYALWVLQMIGCHAVLATAFVPQMNAGWTLHFQALYFVATVALHLVVMWYSLMSQAPCVAVCTVGVVREVCVLLKSHKYV